MAGIYSKYICVHNYVAYNDVYENGELDKDYGGGIRLMCRKTNYWIVENNMVLNNTGPGIFVRGDYNTFRYNIVRESKNGTLPYESTKGHGIYVHGAGRNSTLYKNIFCDNEGEDIYNVGRGTTGDENTCDSTFNYDDEGITGCTYSCGILPAIPFII